MRQVRMSHLARTYYKFIRRHPDSRPGTWLMTKYGAYQCRHLAFIIYQSQKRQWYGKKKNKRAA